MRGSLGIERHTYKRTSRGNDVRGRFSAAVTMMRATLLLRFAKVGNGMSVFSHEALLVTCVGH